MKIQPAMRIVSSIVAMTLVASLLSGCGSTSRKVELVNVVLESPQSATVEGRPVRLDELSALLRNMGATPQTQIKISVPQEASTAALKQVSARLASGGFRRVVFAKPRRAAAGVVEEIPTAPNGGFAPR